MTLKQWLIHVRNWWYRIIQFPLPRDKEHFWTGVVGSREQHCLICGAEGIDKDISDEELERDNEMQEEYTKLHDKYFGDDDDGQASSL